MSETVDFDGLKRKLPVAAFFEQVMGLKAKAMHSDSIRFSGCPACGLGPPESVRTSVKTTGGKTRWHCFRCEEGGDVIDAAAFYWQLEVPEAARRLAGGLPSMGSTIRKWNIRATEAKSKETPRDEAALREVFAHIRGSKLPPDGRVMEYLAGRGITADVAKEAIKRGVLATLPGNPARAKEWLFDVVGHELLVKSGMLRPDSKVPAICYRPLACFTHNARSAEFRLIRKPQSAEEVKLLFYGPMFPYFWANEGSNDYTIVEGPIDLLSSIVLGTKKNVIGVPGAGRWRPEWFKNLSGKSVLLAVDGDEAGQRAVHKANGLLKVMTDVGANVSVLTYPEPFTSVTPEEDWDVNGFLQWKLSQLQQQQRNSSCGEPSTR
ncbi:toprim domain-containing protein [Achromobacter denitrificans]|uniref:Toprim domain-containing protein n=1 Tax=Achromobacter denitrificans TaxID=32002 RepID=A0ABZ3FWL5_ACHDE